MRCNERFLSPPPHKVTEAKLRKKQYMQEVARLRVREEGLIRKGSRDRKETGGRAKGSRMTHSNAEGHSATKNCTVKAM